jgi:hypothetical protein
MTTDEKLQKHLDFWSGKPLDSPLTSIRVGDVFISRQFKANQPLLERGRIATINDLIVDSFLADYEHLYQIHEQVDQDTFFVAEPLNGFPWLEAICGCDIVGSEVSFVATHRFETIDDLETIGFTPDNPWYLKYLEFLEKTAALAAGRYPLGQPILRGVSDTIGALVGQEEMACGLISDSAKMTRLFGEVVHLHRSLIGAAYTLIQPFRDGYAFGFYRIWAPGKVIWFQEDLAAIMAPRHFDQFLRKTATDLCEHYAYTLEHLHPASFGHLDGILSLPGLSAVQINREDVGPSLAQILPQLQSVINAGKKLIIFGALDAADIDAIAFGLPKHSVALHALTDTVDSANTLRDHIKERCAAAGWRT